MRHLEFLTVKKYKLKELLCLTIHVSCQIKNRFKKDNLQISYLLKDNYLTK